MAAADQDDNLPAVDLKILSLNICGLRKKTYFLKNIILKYKPDIICLQETNISDDYSMNKAIYELGLKSENCFFNYPTTKSNGTAILCISSVFKINNAEYFDEGRSIILQFQINEINYTIVNVYAPTIPTQRHHYFNELFTHLESTHINTLSFQYLP